MIVLADSHYPMLMKRLTLYRDGVLATKRWRCTAHVIMLEETPDGVALHLDVAWTERREQNAVLQYRQRARRYTRQEAKLTGPMTASRSKPAVKEKPKPRRYTVRVVNAETSALCELLDAYGYDVFLSRRARRVGIMHGSYSIRYGKSLVARIYPRVRNGRVKVVFTGGLAYTLPHSVHKPACASFLDQGLAGWRAEDALANGSYEHISYRGPLVPELLWAFGIDPNGPVPSRHHRHRAVDASLMPETPYSRGHVVEVIQGAYNAKVNRKIADQVHRRKMDLLMVRKGN